MCKSPEAPTLVLTRIRRFSRIVFGGLFLALTLSAYGDQCPGSDTCPTNQTSIVQGPNAIEVKWIEPANLPIVYLLTTTPAAPGQPVQEQVISPNDWQDRLIFNLQPSTSYTVKICGYYSSSNQSCVATSAVTTLPQSTGGDTPTPTITSASATTTTITLSWNGNRSYDFYQVLGGNMAQAQTGGGPTGSFPFMGLRPATSYLLQVQGCVNGFWHSYCSQWAGINASTTAPPPLPAIAPQNLHTVNGASDIQVVWTDPPGVEQTNVSRAPGFSPSPLPWLSGTDLDDISAVPGQLYTYKVCLSYQSGTACAS